MLILAELIVCSTRGFACILAKFKIKFKLCQCIPFLWSLYLIVVSDTDALAHAHVRGIADLLMSFDNLICVNENYSYTTWTTKLKLSLKWCRLLKICRQLYCSGITNTTFKIKPFGTHIFYRRGGAGISKPVVPINMKFCRVLETSLNVSEMLNFLRSRLNK